jgi:hypothetical protein
VAQQQVLEQMEETLFLDQLQLLEAVLQAAQEGREGAQEILTHHHQDRELLDKEITEAQIQLAVHITHQVVAEQAQ